MAVEEYLIGGILLGLGIATILLLALGLYIYTALAWYTIAKKLKNKNAWLAWIPIANIALLLQLGGFHWALIFLILIPILGWAALAVLYIIATWKIYKKRNYPGWFSLAFLLPSIGGIVSMTILGFVAWKDRKKMLFE